MSHPAEYLVILYCCYPIYSLLQSTEREENSKQCFGSYWSQEIKIYIIEVVGKNYYK